MVFEDFSYRYPAARDRWPALDHVSLEVEAGEFVGVVGPSGAGKSTLAQATVGLVPHFYRGAVGGRVVVDGVDTLRSSVAELARRVGLVFQNPFTQVSGAKLTVFEEVALGLENLGVPRDEMRRRVEEALAALGIAHLRDRNPFALSGGEMQRLAIACIMALRPRIVVLDEPTSQLDPTGTAEVFAAVEALRKRGVTIVMVEQKVERLAEHADRVVLLERGRVVADGSPAEVFSRPDLESHGVRRPVYAEAARRLGVAPGGRLPVTLAEAVAALGPAPAPEAATGPRAATGPQADSTPAPGDRALGPRGGGTPVTAVKALGVRFGYVPGEEVLRGVTLELVAPEAVAVVGQNGAGKTTFARLLSGLLRPTHGVVLVDGRDTREHTPARLAAKVGLVFQNPSDQIFKSRTLDEVMFGPLNLGVPRKEAEARAMAALERVGLAQAARRNPYDSGLAERKLIGIASILAMRTPVVVFDEPTIGQDHRGVELVRSIVRELVDEGRLVLTITHDMDFVASTFERTVVFRRGEVTADGPTRRVFASPDRLADSFLEEPHVTRLGRALGHRETLLTVAELARVHRARREAP
ncbi:MAG: ATP-binding cassette domain-containing protein [Firmicutes bacterium]|nr:ATP-binding cassette domain-containing protein [Bacillota bacterium]